MVSKEGDCIMMPPMTKGSMLETPFIDACRSGPVLLACRFRSGHGRPVWETELCRRGWSDQFLRAEMPSDTWV
ncbi:MAG: hypothetical protein ACLS8R_04340 [Anaeromassilibacillus sp.]